MTLGAIAFIFLAVAAAQTFGSMFGGGGFMVQMALLSVNIPAKAAIANDIASAAFGSIAYLLTTKTHSPFIRSVSFRFAPSLVIGALLGSYTMTLIPESVVKWIVLSVCTIGVLYVVSHLKSKPAAHKKAALKYWPIILPVAGVFFGFYEGFIGAGSGIIILMALSIILRSDMKSLISIANFCSALSLGAAGAMYGFKGYLDWNLLAILIPACLLAGFSGAKIADYVSEEKLQRIYIVILGLLLSYLLIKNLAIL